MAPRSRKNQQDNTAEQHTSQAAASDSEQQAAPKSKRKARSIYLDEELLDRARAAVTALGSYQPEAGVRSLSDIFEPGGWAEVERLEREYNNGQPFTPVAKMPTGRPY